MKAAALINECLHDKILNVVPDRRACVFYRSCLDRKWELSQIGPTVGVKAEGRGWEQNMMLERSAKQHWKCYKETQNRSFIIEDTCNTFTVLIQHVWHWPTSTQVLKLLSSPVCTQFLSKHLTNMHTYTSWWYYSQVRPPHGICFGLITWTPLWRSPDGLATSSGGSEPSPQVPSHLYHWQHHCMDGKCHQEGMPGPIEGDAFSKENRLPQPAEHLHQMLQVKGIADFQQSCIHFDCTVCCKQLCVCDKISLLLLFIKLCSLQLTFYSVCSWALNWRQTTAVCVHRVYLMVTAWQETLKHFSMQLSSTTAVTFKYCSWFCFSLSLPVIWFSSFVKLKSPNEENNPFKLFMSNKSESVFYVEVLRGWKVHFTVAVL